MIESVRIRGFRSFRDVSLQGLGGFVAIAGRNGVGKSNILRALNLFFNGQVEPGLGLDLRRDFHRAGQSKAKQVIRVEVGFSLPSSFKFRKGVKEQATALGLTSPGLRLARQWELDPVTRLVTDAFLLLDGEGRWSEVASAKRDLVELFLSRLIRFRYVPNHIHPMELIRDEQESLQHELIARINRSRAAVTDAPLEAMTAIAGQLMQPVAMEVRATAPELSDVALATPASWADIALTLNLELESAGDLQRAARIHGSGHQSLLAYSLLHLIDTSYSTKFGWHQATIWGIEEPESFLHQELAIRLGSLLRQYALDDRFQILATTHSPTIMATATNGLLVETGSTPERLAPADLLTKAARSGAAPFVHPLLAGAPRPLLLVEGPTDVDHIKQAYAYSGRANLWEIRAVEEFAVASGESGFEQLLRHNAVLIGARPLGSPVVMVFDHDIGKDKVAALSTKLAAIHSASAVVAWEPHTANADLDLKHFTGIEAFLSTEALAAAEEQGVITLLRPAAGTPIACDLRKGPNKPGIVRVCRERACGSDYVLFGPLMERLENLLLGRRGPAG